MKKTISVTVDLDQYIELKARTDNMSGTINNFIIEYNKIPIDKFNLSEQQKLKVEVDRKVVEISKLKEKIKELEEKAKPKDIIMEIDTEDENYYRKRLSQGNDFR